MSHMNESCHIWVSHVTYESVTWIRDVNRAPQKSWRIRCANQSATSRLLTKAHGIYCSWPLVRCRCVAVRCSALQYVANTSATSRLLMRARGICCSWPPVEALCCSVLQCVAVCCSVLQCVAACCKHISQHSLWDMRRMQHTYCNTLEHVYMYM